ncbi:protein FAM151B-like [Seriola lalandi dorsalis]|uniref:protein FAM151B-like n=1 Tax=Seriola lalandi dorsalis TaxID=1841481 RepID=UPI000C6FA238|nr:protein FAM151B-like [Seriola lalandi dorsalis]
MSDRTLEYFLSLNQITKKDASEVKWSHAVNSRSRLTEALTGPMHMLEADIIIRGRDPKEPVMAHPPDTDSDITLKEWLEAVKAHDKGIKLDFKSKTCYSWDTVRVMEEICRTLEHPVTFPVRAALLSQSFSQLKWLLQQSDRYTLTVWTGRNDVVTQEDLLPYRKEIHISRIYYDLDL